MCCWPDFNAAEHVIELYKEVVIGSPDINQPENEFKTHCDRLWAADNLLAYLSDNWFDDIPLELIADYVDDCRYRAEKYNEENMGKTYETARRTAEEIMGYFVCEEDL